MLIDPGLLTLAGSVIAVSIFLVTLLSTDAAVILLVLSMLLSPEIALAQTATRAVVVRLDDLLLCVVFFTWLAKLAVNKQLGLVRQTPLNWPLGALIAVCLGSTMWGMIDGTVERPIVGFFYVLKYIEYLVLYFMAANVIRTERQVHLFLRVVLLTAAIVGILGYVQIMQHGPGYRITAPFEGKAEPNTLAGYLLLIMCLSAGLAIHVRSASRRILLLSLIFFLIPPFLFTYSRGGYLSFVASYLALCALSKRYKPLLVALLLIGAFVARFYLPVSVYQRIADTFDPRGRFEVAGVHLTASPASRIMIWKYGLEKLSERPILGFGVTGIGFVDSQYVLILGELGLMGLAVFTWIWWTILTISYRAFKLVTDPLGQGLNLGFVCGFIGLLVLSFTGNVFVIVRIMEPFWFLAAMVLTLPSVVAHIGTPQATETTATPSIAVASP